MRKHIFFMLIIALLSARIGASEFQSRVWQLGDEVNQAGIAGDFKKIVGAMPPRIVALGGGPAAVLAAAKAAADKIAAEGMTITSVKTDKPGELISTKSTMFFLLPTEMEISIPGGRAVGKSNLLAISEDKGKNWRFIHAEALTPEMQKQFYPDSVSVLTIPPKQKAVVFR